MRALRDFSTWVKAVGPSAPKSNGSAPAPSASRQGEVTKRLAALIGPYKEAVAQNGPAAAQMQAHMAAAKKHITQRDFAQAARDLDELEPLVAQTSAQSPAPAGSPAPTRGPAPAGSPAPAGPPPTEGSTPNATSTDLFFDKRSAKLTDSDKDSLDAYASAYRRQQSSEKIVVDGYASIEGDPQFNQKLSQDRANAVAEYLKKKGVHKIETHGHGATNHFSDKELSPNRRATIQPPPNLTVRDIVGKVEDDGPRNIPIPGKKPNPTLEEAEKLDLSKLPIPEPPEEPPAPQDVVPTAKKPKSDKDDDLEASINEETRLYGGSSSDPRNSVYIELKYTLTIRARDGAWVLPNIELTLSVGKNGKIGPVTEAQLNLIQKKWENLKVAGKTFNAQLSLSLNGVVELDSGKLASIKRSVQAELELEITKRTSLKFDVKKEETVYQDPSTAPPPGTPPPKEPEVAVVVSRKIGGGDDKKKARGKESAKEKESHGAAQDAIERNWQEYEKARDAILSKLPEDAINVRAQAQKEMDRAAQSEVLFVASADLKADLKALDFSLLEEEMKKVVEAYVEKIRRAAGGKDK